VKRSAAVLFAGLLFGAGLVVSGMTEPRNVIGFLDFAGDWNPSLAGVMIGAIGVHMALLALLRRRAGTPASASTPPSVDRRLVAGAAIFGVGWGLSGYCPGPAIVSLGLGLPVAFGFLAAMIAGSLAADVAIAQRVIAQQADGRRAGDPAPAEADLTCSAEG
jgi:uncharacterized membrane protein YedE/YeeE